MKPHELTVYNYLRSIGFDDIQYEPIRNETPDFLVNGKVAIEVRRLNENYGSVGDFEGLEQMRLKLFSIIRKILLEFPSERVKHSAFLAVQFDRSLTIDAKLRKSIKKILENHLPYLDERRQYDVDNLRIDIFPSSTKYDTIYREGISSDDNSGGQVIDLLYKNLEMIIREKEIKISKNQHLYPEWWLALVDIDYLTYLYPEDWVHFYNMPRIETVFKRILIVPAYKETRGVFLYEIN